MQEVNVILRRRYLIGVASLVILSGSARSRAQQAAPHYGEVENWKEICQQATAKPLPAEAHSGPLSAEQLSTCDETQLYYGIHGKPNYPAALQCGWYERAHPKHSEANIFAGPGVLSMLYANGQGTPKDLALATRFICENEWAADAETALRLGHLQSMKNTTTTFDICDDITSGMGAGFCENLSAQKEEVVRDKKIAALIGGLPPAARAAFPELEKAQRQFQEARATNEIDLSGTMRGAFAASEEKKQADQFLINLERFGRGGIPAASETDLTTLDRQLHEIYEQLMQAPASKWENGTIQPEGIRDTERKWISLTDSWLTFAKLAYPKVSANSIHAQLIRLRLHQLRSLAKD